MPAPAVQLRPFLVPPSVAAPVPGVDNFAPLVSVSEGTSVGEPPIAPVLVQQIGVPQSIRRLVLASGGISTQPLPDASRPTIQITWPPLTQAQRDAMLLWFRSVVQQGLQAFTLRVDGADQSTSIVVRQVGQVSIGEINRGVFEGLSCVAEVVR